MLNKVFLGMPSASIVDEIRKRHPQKTKYRLAMYTSNEPSGKHVFEFDEQIDLKYIDADTYEVAEPFNEMEELRYPENLLSVIDENGAVSSLGYYCFGSGECCNLKFIGTPYATKADECAIYMCNELEHVDLSSMIDVKYISDCEKLLELNLPNLERIDNYGVQNLPSLTAVNMPKLENFAGNFFDFQNLISVNLSSCKTLNDSMFNGCTARKILVDSAETIENDAFYGVQNLETLNIPKAEILKKSVFAQSKIKSISCESVKQIGDRCFDGCADLLSVDFGNLENPPTLGEYVIPLSQVNNKFRFITKDYSTCQKFIKSDQQQFRQHTVFKGETFNGKWILDAETDPIVLEFSYYNGGTWFTNEKGYVELAKRWSTDPQRPSEWELYYSGNTFYAETTTFTETTLTFDVDGTLHTLNWQAN